jgi:hypothetical protein
MARLPLEPPARVAHDREDKTEHASWLPSQIARNHPVTIWPACPTRTISITTTFRPATRAGSQSRSP